MKLLERYVGKSVLYSIGMVTLMLIGLQVFILLVDQFNDLGKMDYKLADAVLYVLMTLPYQVYLFFPMACLLGTLIGLGLLANHSELIVMRSAGMSIIQITTAVLKIAFFLILIVTCIGETLLPYLSYNAKSLKAAAISGGQTLKTARGFWMRNKNDFVLIGNVDSQNKLGSITQFHFNSNHHLKFARNIKTAIYKTDGWHAYGVVESQFKGRRVMAQTYDELKWDVFIKPKILSIHSIDPDEMNLKELNRYIREQKHNHQNVTSYQLAFWQRLIQPFTTVVMMILAIPFIFGPLRSSTIGSKLVVGAVVGFGFHILNRFLGPISTVYQLPPQLAAIVPTLLFAILGIYMMKKVR